jgi:hypothetical protein
MSLMVTEPKATDVRLAELMSALSLVVDLGLGQPTEHILRLVQMTPSARAGC